MNETMTKYEKAAQRIKSIFENNRKLILNKKDEYLDDSKEDVSKEFKEEYGYAALEALSDEEKINKLVWKVGEEESLYYDLTQGKYKNYGTINISQERNIYLAMLDSEGGKYVISDQYRKEKNEDKADEVDVHKQITLFITGLKEAERVIETLDSNSSSGEYNDAHQAILNKVKNGYMLVVLNKYFSLLYPQKWTKFIEKDYSQKAVQELLNKMTSSHREAQSELMKIQYLLTENGDMTSYEFWLTYDELIHRKAGNYEKNYKEYLWKHIIKDGNIDMLRGEADRASTERKIIPIKQLLLDIKSLSEDEKNELNQLPDNLFSLPPYEFKKAQELIKDVGNNYQKDLENIFDIKNFADDYAQCLKDKYELGFNLEYTSKLKASKNIIFRGAPGTGKTYLARQIAADIISRGWTSDFERLTEEEKSRFEFIQFHPSYDYTDFVEGYRPVNGKDNQMGFKLMPGVFKKFLTHAIDSEKPHVFVIDEINRGEISKIFGELFFAIDPGYRGKHGAVKTQYSSIQNAEETLYIPKNVYIIGTMNDIDRSVEHFDFAMRRRFRFIEIKAENQLKMLSDLKEYDEAVNYLTRLNEQISNTDNLNAHYHIGPSYFLKLKEFEGCENKFELLWDDYLEPLLEEYVRGFFGEENILKKLKDAYNDVEQENQDH